MANTAMLDDYYDAEGRLHLIAAFGAAGEVCLTARTAGPLALSTTTTELALSQVQMQRLVSAWLAYETGRVATVPEEDE